MTDLGVTCKVVVVVRLTDEDLTETAEAQGKKLDADAASQDRAVVVEACEYVLKRALEGKTRERNLVKTSTLRVVKESSSNEWKKEDE